MSSNSSPPLSPHPRPHGTATAETAHLTEEEGSQEPAQIYDLVIVGAGPAALAACARLCEETPAALFTDEEHRRYHWVKSSVSAAKAAATKKPRGSKVASRHASGLPPPTPPASPRSDGMSLPEQPAPGSGQTLGQCYHTLVLDSSVCSSGTGSDSEARFMARWCRSFEALGITLLRSPMFFHVDPSDRDSLLAFAHSSSSYTPSGACRYATDCIEIGGVVGRELSKHRRKQRRGHHFVSSQSHAQINERDRSDYRVPSANLFVEHCRDVVDRYGLDERRLLRPAEVVSIDYGQAGTLVSPGACEVAGVDPDIDSVFRIGCASGSSIFARVVLCATGAGSGPASLHNGHLQPRWPTEAACHLSQLKPGDIPGAALRWRIAQKQPTSAIVVGGGLSSAQLVDLLLRRGVDRVWLLLRARSLRVKPFDVDLEWIGKYGNGEKASFWSADDDDERLQMVRNARGGGSVPAPWAKRLKSWEIKGRLRVCTSCIIEDINSVQTDPESQRWRVSTSPSVEKLGAVDYVYFATGPTGLKDMYVQGCDLPVAPSIPPFLRIMQERHPMRWFEGLPALTDSLAWCSSCDGQEEIPLYVTGALAALRLGPGAANLEGARLGAERIAWALERLPWAKERAKISRNKSGLTAETKHLDYMRGIGGRFGSLDDQES